jgi:DNA primase
MEISEIKAQLTINQVLDHYGLKANPSKMLCCPFHDDKTPSMQVYTETNTVHCFSSNCKLHGKAVDVIDFIMHHEGITKHEAILKAKELIGYSEPSQPFEKLFKLFQSTLKRNDKAQAYLKERNIEKAEVGFNDGTWESLKQCVIFPLRDKKNKITSFYGRSIYNNEEARHFYTRNRKGLYPNYPKADTKQLILTEAIIDAATLLQCTDNKILACYGTNGFTAEHEQAIKDLKQLEEIIIFFDGDEAGREGSKRVAEKLSTVFKGKLSMVNTPEGEDVNSLAQSHEPEIFTHLLSTRKLFSFSTEEKKTEIKSVVNPQFDSSNPLKIIYRTLLCEGRIAQRGRQHESELGHRTPTEQQEEPKQIGSVRGQASGKDST